MAPFLLFVNLTLRGGKLSTDVYPFRIAPILMILPDSESSRRDLSFETHFVFFVFFLVRPSVRKFFRPSVRPKIFRPSVRKFSVRPKFFRPSENFPSVCERICFYIKLSPHTSIYLINFSQPFLKFFSFLNLKPPGP